MGPQLFDFIGMGTDPSEIRSLMQGTETDYLPPYAIEEKDMGSYLEQGDLTYYDRSLRFRNFLTGTFVSNVYDSNIEQYAKEKFKNIFFTDAAVQNHYNPTQLRQNVLDDACIYINRSAKKQPWVNYGYCQRPQFWHVYIYIEGRV